MAYRKTHIVNDPLTPTDGIQNIVGDLDVNGDITISGTISSNNLFGGPSTDHAIARFNSTSGKLQDSSIVIEDDGDLIIAAGNSLQFGDSSVKIEETDTNVLTLTGNRQALVFGGAEQLVYATDFTEFGGWDTGLPAVKIDSSLDFVVNESGGGYVSLSAINTAGDKYALQFVQFMGGAPQAAMHVNSAAAFGVTKLLLTPNLLEMKNNVFTTGIFRVGIDNSGSNTRISFDTNPTNYLDVATGAGWTFYSGSNFVFTDPVAVTGRVSSTTGLAAGGVSSVKIAAYIATVDNSLILTGSFSPDGKIISLIGF